MSNEELEKLKSSFNGLQEKREEVLKLGREIKLYEQLPVVQKYLKLVELYRKNTTGDMYNFDKKTDDDLLFSSLNSVKINSTNNIYVYMGAYRTDYDFGVYRIDDNRDIGFCETDYKKYRNLELMAYQDGYEVDVPISQCEKFEKDNIVICPDNTYLSDTYYLKLRDEFFETAVFESQEKALEKILNKRQII